MSKLKSKDFWNATIIRAIKTMAQVAGSMLVIGAFNETGWILLAETTITSGIASILTSIATGLPEVDVEEGGEE